MNILFTIPMGLVVGVSIKIMGSDANRIFASLVAHPIVSLRSLLDDPFVWLPAVILLFLAWLSGWETVKLKRYDMSLPEDKQCAIVSEDGLVFWAPYARYSDVKVGSKVWSMQWEPVSRMQLLHIVHGMYSD